jgi:tetratricopeptide (TPR) repeat protein
MRTIVLVLAARIVFGQPALWEQHMREAGALERAGRDKEARAAYQLALKDEQKPSDSGFRQAMTWNNLALIDRYLGSYSEARQQYGQALVWFEKSRGSSSPEYASALHKPGCPGVPGRTAR